ncbi:MAG: tetratricopeptide repeat protein [Candidatus Rokubacteria bacterium]|nr:tetratricopeptide repeat protein [Candidatus Rokubacteria bacterium]
MSEREVVRLLRLTPKLSAQLRRLGLLKPQGIGYRFREVVGVRVARGLLAGGATVRQVRRVVEDLRRLLPDSDSPLAELRLKVDGRRILVERDGVSFDPRTGQTLLTLDVGDLEREARATLARGMVRPLVPPSQRAEVWFARASELDQDPSSWESAISAYEQVVAIDPAFAAGWNNLGLLHHRMGHYEKGEECYRAALAADEACYQAAYNLGSLTEDLSDLQGAIGWYGRALELAPDYADAHFNLAGVLAKVARPQDAALHWRRYLELDLGSPWAEIARVHLGEVEDVAFEVEDEPSSP